MIAVLGVDTSLRNFGFAISTFVDGRLQVCRVGVHCPSDELSDSDRLGLHFRATRAWVHQLEEMAHPGAIQRLGVEAVAYIPGKVRWSVLTALARARQVVDDVALSSGCEQPIEVSAANVGKAALDRPGKGTKADRILSLRQRFPQFRESLDGGDLRLSHWEHAADAFAVTLYVARTMGEFLGSWRA